MKNICNKCLATVTVTIMLASYLAGCSVNGKKDYVLSGSYCMATADNVTGDRDVPNSVIQLSDITVNLNHTTSTGPFEITIAGQSYHTSNTTFNLKGTVSIHTGNDGGYNAPVTVRDNSNNLLAECAIVAIGKLPLKTSDISLTSSPEDTVPVGSTITLTASSMKDVVGQYSFFIMDPKPAGVQLTTVSDNTAIITSSSAVNVGVLVNATTSIGNTIVGFTFVQFVGVY